jgi:hypothetical protein
MIFSMPRLPACRNDFIGFQFREFGAIISNP